MSLSPIRFDRAARRLALAACFLPAAAPVVQAQARPSAAQAQALLQARPELASQLRQQIAGNGLTPAQVRARLVAEGYPANLLDAYLGQGGGEATTPTTEVFEAVRALGLVGEADLEELMRLTSDRAGRDREPSIAEKAAADSGRTIFGLALFREQSSLFLPNLDGPVDANYRVGPGDQLVLILTGDVELAHTLDVTREGFVVIPQVGQIGVANLTLGELEDLLYARLGRVYSGVRRGSAATTRFSISVARLRSNQVFVAGDVVAPGSYRVTSAGTALTALYAAGGPSDLGSLRQIEVRRGGQVVSTLDVYGYLLRGDAAADVRLQQGDVVFVPVHARRARIFGGVARPATYELRAGESLADLVRAAGGLKATAAQRRLAIERILPPDERTLGRDRAVIEVALNADGSIPPVAIEDGDIVRVPTVSDRVRARVVVNGHVWSAGDQGYTPGLTLADALARAGGLQPDAFLGTVHVSRLRPDSTRVQLRATLRDTTGATLEPFPLQEDDQVTVYSRTAFRPDRFVVISGAVRRSGRYPYRYGMTLRDLALMAGGVTENAYLVEAELARIDASTDARRTARAMRVRIDSTYLFETAVTATTDEIPLEPYDNVLIFQDPSRRAPRSVYLSGEVRFPGRFTLENRGERLSELLRRAGGLTAEADIDGAYFTRLVDTLQTRLAREAQERRTTRVAGTAPTTVVPPAPGLAADSAAKALARLDNVGERIRVGIELQEAMRGGRRDDLVLEDGDSLHIPQVQQTVEVRGAVNAPTALVHAGKRLGYYLDAAGGPTERARQRRAYVIQPSGKIQSRRRVLGFITLDPTPRPGATVVVPDRGEVLPQSNALANISVVTQLLASLAAIVALSR